MKSTASLLLIISFWLSAALAAPDCSAELSALLANSPNRIGVEALVEAKHKANRIIAGGELESGRKALAIRRRFDGTTDIVIKESGKETLLYSHRSEDRARDIVGLFASPGEKKIAAVFHDKGNSESFILSILDIKTKKWIAGNLYVSDYNNLFWTSDDDLLMESRTSEGKPKVARWNAQTDAVTFTKATTLVATGDHWATLDYPEYSVLLNDKGVRYKVDSSQTIDEPLEPMKDGRIIFRAEGIHGLGELRVVVPPKNSSSDGQTEFFYRSQGRFIEEVISLPEHVLAVTRWGADRRLELLDRKGKLVQSVVFPNCCSLISAEWLTEGRRLKIRFTSAFKEKHYFVYNLASQSFEDRDLESKMMSYSKTEMVSGIVEVTSADGAKIPMRLTHRKDLKRDGKNPVLMDVYGGFGHGGFLDPAYEKMRAEFILRGGIVAGPALRGGNEFGAEYEETAARMKKIKTMEDLIASARWMVSSGWSSATRIVTHGTSNGGFVIASAALLAPDAFGLVIPVAGVYDLIDLPKKDPVFGRSWMRDYGNSAKARNHWWISKVSPVALAADAKSIPEIMMVVGTDDSRVNPAHTDALEQALKANPNPKVHDRVSVLRIENAGHGVESFTPHGMPAFEANVGIWTRIYDFLGMKLE